MIEGIFVEGLIFAIMALGILISYRILDLADLTCDGSVATGAAVATMCIVNGLGITVGLIMAFLVGVLTGLVTATIHNKLKIPALLAGILTMTMLYSVNLRILGNKANVSLVRVDTLYRLFPKWFSFIPSDWAALLGTLIFVVVVTVLMDLFFRSDIGMAIGALGGNEQVIISQGMNPSVLKMIGLGLSNGLIALSGGLLAQYQGFADANLGQGMVVQGLAAVMIGEFLFSSNTLTSYALFLVKLMPLTTLSEREIFPLFPKSIVILNGFPSSLKFTCRNAPSFARNRIISFTMPSGKPREKLSGESGSKTS